uniref:DnaJ homologue subfamily C GRV2/DNAJC13 N-terminal domain-containing protein n=1 Tax=Salmo trutta TaxID=8032 RepID=A0A673ZKQ0_SALTR
MSDQALTFRLDDNSSLTKCLCLSFSDGNFADAVFRFNANVSYSGVLHAVTQDGLFSENKEKLISNAILALLSQECELPGLNAELESHFHAIRRLVASKAGFQAFTQLPKFREKLGVKTVKALKRNNNGVTHAAIDMLCALMCVSAICIPRGGTESAHTPSYTQYWCGDMTVHRM